MPLPHTTNYPLIWVDAAEKFVNKDASNNVVSIINKINEGLILPETAASVPQWADNQINGYPALIFSGAQSMYYNLPINAGSVGILKPLMLTVVAKINTFSPVFTLSSFRSQNNSNTNFYLFGGVIGTNKMVAARYDDNGNSDFTSFSGFDADTNYHIYTNVFDGNTIKIRIDGVEKASVAVTAGIDMCTTNKMFIGSAGGVAGCVNGQIAELILYTGNYNTTMDLTPELYLKEKYSL